MKIQVKISAAKFEAGKRKDFNSAKAMNSQVKTSAAKFEAGKRKDFNSAKAMNKRNRGE